MRIISAAPSNTEILYAIGAGSDIVGVTAFCNYQKEAKDKAEAERAQHKNNKDGRLPERIFRTEPRARQGA